MSAPSVRERAPRTPSDLAAVCDRALQGAPDARFATVREMAEVLEGSLDALPALTSTVQTSSAPPRSVTRRQMMRMLASAGLVAGTTWGVTEFLDWKSEQRRLEKERIDRDRWAKHLRLDRRHIFYDGFALPPWKRGWRKADFWTGKTVVLPHWDESTRVTGVGSGYPPKARQTDYPYPWMWHALPIDNGHAFRVVFRARSGAQQPNQAKVTLGVTTGSRAGEPAANAYRLEVYGETGSLVIAREDKDGKRDTLGTIAIGESIAQFHTYDVSHHPDGTWDISIDGEPRSEPVEPDATGMRLDFVAFQVFRNQSQIDEILVAPSPRV